jgi:ribonuclease R
VKKRKKAKSKPKEKNSYLAKLSNIIIHILSEAKKPLTYREIKSKLPSGPKWVVLLPEALELLSEKQQVEKKGQRYSFVLPKHIEGVISVHPRGFGFVSHAEENLKDIFIPKPKMETAVDGDTVEVELLPSTPKGPEGKVVAIIKRGKKTLAGTIICSEDAHFLVYCPSLGPKKKVHLKKPKTTLSPGERVLMKIIDWDPEITCELIEKLGNIKDPSKDVHCALLEFEIAKLFPKEVLQQVEECQITDKEIQKRKDFRSKEVITIDPTTAKDFDDALSCERTKEGGYILDVHIADVSHFVKKDTPLDEEAKKRGNSVYFPGKCIPMLPPQLSENLCSLISNKPRLTITVTMAFSKTGTLLSSSVDKSVIESQKRFTYEEAFSVLQGKGKSPYTDLLIRLKELCLLLKKQRSQRGSIDLALPEPVIIVDDSGDPQKMQIVAYDITHQMVEECMLKANEVIATILADRGNGLIYRVHEHPTEEAFGDFFTFAKILGFNLPPNPKPKDIQKLFEQAKKTPFLERLSIAFIRSMKLALYSPDNIGHFGLALENYTHFTSPIRRYTDLIIHRLLFDDSMSSRDLKKIASHCSDKERLAMKAENSVLQLKKLRLLKKYLEQDPHREYQATITKIRPFGIEFELDQLFLEGSLHISELGDDYYLYDEKKLTITGKWSKEKFACHTKIFVMIENVDLIKQEASFYYLSRAKKKSKR